MLKNLFKSAKKALKNPIVQLGIGALLPQSAMFQSLAKAAPILSNPAVLQGGIGLLAGDKPIDIARNIGIQSLLGGFRGLGEGGPGFTEGMKRTFQTQTEKQRLIDEIEDAIPDIKKTKDSVVDKVFEAASKIKPETYLGFAEVALPFALAKMAQDNVPQVTPQDIGVGNLDEYNRMLQESRFQNTGGIAGYAKGGSKEASIGINSLTGDSVVDRVFEAASKIKPETYLGFAEVALPFALAKMAQDNVPQVTPQDIGVGNLDEYNRMLQESRFQNTGGIAGYAKGGSKEASIGINSLTGEPSGMVTGPGTGKSDSIRFTSGGAKIPTDISDGEFIMTAKATEKIGADNLYKMMNNADPESETAAEGKQRVAMA